eukprot:ANDGO_02260.mRNA.1 AP-4 complex subunit mu
MISQFFVLSRRGDIIIFRDYRGDVTKKSSEVFFRNIHQRSSTEAVNAAPVFSVDGVSFMFSRKSGMYFVITTRCNMSPVFGFEVINRITRIIRDYTGILSEDAVRKNFVLIYELADEVIDFGYPQEMSTENLKSLVFNEPVESEGQQSSALASAMDKLRIGEKKTASSSSAQRSVIGSAEKEKKPNANELFVDILEKLHATFDGTGKLQNSYIEGSIIMRSFLSGSPEIHVGLNSDLQVGRDGKSSGRSGLVLDSINFHPLVQRSEFESDRVVALYPPDGEFTVLNYRTSGECPMPFRVYPYLEDAGNFRIDLIIRIRGEFPEQCHATHVVVQFPVPDLVASVNFEVGSTAGGQETEYKAGEKMGYWRIKKFTGGSEYAVRAKMSFNTTAPSALSRKQIGPIVMSFEIPMFNVSGLNLRFLRIQERDKSYNPARWVRYITQSNSYTSRL